MLLKNRSKNRSINNCPSQTTFLNSHTISMIGLHRFRITISKKTREDVDKIIESLNSLFTNKGEERHIDDNTFLLSKAESGNRITIVLILFCALLLGFTQLIMGLVMLKANDGVYGQYVYDQGDMHDTPINMNLNLIYYLGADSFLVDVGKLTEWT